MEKYIKMMRKKHNDNSKSSLNDNNQSKSSLVEQQAVPSNDSNIEYLQAPPKIQRPSSASRRPTSKNRSDDAQQLDRNDDGLQIALPTSDEMKPLSAGKRPITASTRNRTADQTVSEPRIQMDGEEMFPGPFNNHDSHLDDPPSERTSNNMITPQQNSGRESDYGGAISGRGGGRGSYSDGDDALILDPELQVLWAAIDCYKPDRVKLKPVLKSFLPEYMPAIGDIDPMIKIPQDNLLASEDLKLGIRFIDEPAIEQSDPTVIDLRLRAQNKSSTQTKTAANVRSVNLALPDAGKQLEKWCASVVDLHSNIQPDKVTYSRPMPSVESLMRSWDENGVTQDSENDLALEMKIKDFMKKFLSTANSKEHVNWSDLGTTLEQLVAWSCLLVDIPVYPKPPANGGGSLNVKSRSHIESCHVLFRLYLEFKNSHHFGKINSKTVPAN